MLLTMKMKLTISVSLILTILLLLVGCGDDVTKYIENLETDGRVIGAIHGVVTDANTNARLDGIQVTTVVVGEILSTTTDNLGYYAITDLSSGEYEISYSGNSDYGVGRVTATIPTLQQIGITNNPTDEDFNYSEKMDMNLYRLNAGLTGIIWTKQDDENTNLAATVTVIADFANYDISPDEYTVATNSEGVFSFTDLPATPSVSIRSMPFNDGTYDYSVQTATVSLTPNGTVSAGNILLQIAPAEPFIVQNNFENDGFGLTENLIVTFSKAMDINSLDIELRSNTHGNVEFEATWDDNIILTLDPFVVLQANETYILSLSGDSQDNNDFSETFTFETQEGIQFIKTNLERVDGVFDQFDVGSNIEITFTMEVDLNNYNGHVTMYDEDNAVVSISLSTDSTTLTIDPLYNLEPGQNYTLYYRVYSAIEGDYGSDQFYFETASDATVPAQVTGFTVDMGDYWKADWNTTSISFKWNTVGTADHYRIYAKDNSDNTDLVRVASLSAQDYVTDQSGTVHLYLYPQFDFYDDDGIQTPFSGGTELTFKIVAYNDAGEGTFSESVVVKDETAPSITISQIGSADNTTGENVEFVVNLNQIEYCSSTNNPTFTFVEYGGDPNYVFPSSAIVWVWDPNLRDGQATVTVPDSKCGAGDMLITTVIDNSGNTSDPDTLYLTPIISFESPTVDTTWEAPNAFIDWSISNTGANPIINSVDVWLSIDGGTSWSDTLTEGTYSTYYNWSIPDTLMSDAQSVIGITNSEGGYTWKSNLFTISGIRVTEPTAIQQDSAIVKIDWDYAEIDSVLIEYSNNGWTWTPVDTLYNTGTYDWTPQLDLTVQRDYKVRVSDFDADYRPRDESNWFTIIPK